METFLFEKISSKYQVIFELPLQFSFPHILDL